MNTIEELKNFLVKARLIKSSQRIDENESLIESGIIDSLGIVELIEYMEDTYGIVVGEEDLVPENFDTLAAIQALISKRIAS